MDDGGCLHVCSGVWDMLIQNLWDANDGCGDRHFVFSGLLWIWVQFFERGIIYQGMYKVRTSTQSYLSTRLLHIHHPFPSV